MPAHGWAYQISVRGGRVTATTPRVVLAIWSTDANPSPDQLMAKTASFNTGTAMLDAADGISYSRDLQTTAKLRSGKRYAFGFVASDARFGYGKLAVPGSGEIDEVWQRTVSSGPTPQDPFSYTSVLNDYGWLAIWVHYESNVAPEVPFNLSPADDSSITTLTPTFAGDFQDDNETLPNGLPGDVMTVAQIQVRNDVTLATLWDYTYNVSAGEATARRFSAPYAGTALVTGTAYEWRCRVADGFGAWSGWTAWNDFIPGAGSITVSAGTPTGKQETQSPGPFTGVWQHSGGLNATQVKVRILNQTTGEVVRESAYVTIGGAGTVPGGTLSKTFSPLTPLPWGGSWSYQLRAIDSGSTESGWSESRNFTTNAVPSIPALIYPQDGAVTSTRPTLIAFSTDADDLPGSEHVVSARIKDASGNVLQTRTMTYDAVTQTFTYTTTSTDLPTVGTYRWDAYAHDGTVYSSGSAILGSAAISTEAIFEYSSGPSITITSPTASQVIATNTPTYNWTVTGQVRKRIRVYDAVTSLMVYDSGELADSTTAHSQPGGYLQNNGTYSLIVEVWNASNAKGTSAPRAFAVSYSAATAINNFTASLHRANGDIDPTAVLLSWDPTTYSTGQFESYIITRRASEETLFDPDDLVKGENRRIAVITSPSQATFVDYTPASGVEYTYGISQIVSVGTDRIRSPISHVTAQVAFEQTVISDARRGGAFRVALWARKDKTVKYNREQKLVTPWNTSKPTIFRTNRWYREISGEFLISAETADDVEDTINRIQKMDQRGGPLCYRDGRGRRYFGEITAFEEIDQPGGRVRRVSLTFLQTSAAEVADL
jgi:hypothetical protein